VAGYNVYRDGTKVNAVPIGSTSYSDTGLGAGVSHTLHREGPRRRSQPERSQWLLERCTRVRRIHKLRRRRVQDRDRLAEQVVRSLLRRRRR
jgi:hypothetical protein